MPTTVRDAGPEPGAGPLHVAVGVVEQRGRILVARRASHQHQGNLWEFPGGKVEFPETVQRALCRELEEELGLEVDIARLEPLIEVCHEYVDLAVRLDVWWVRHFRGEPCGREGQPLAWVPIEQLHQRAFPAANQPIVDAVQRAHLNR